MFIFNSNPRPSQLAPSLVRTNFGRSGWVLSGWEVANCGSPDCCALSPEALDLSSSVSKHWLSVCDSKDSRIWVRKGWALTLLANNSFLGGLKGFPLLGGWKYLLTTVSGVQSLPTLHFTSSSPFSITPTPSPPLKPYLDLPVPSILFLCFLFSLICSSSSVFIFPTLARCINKITE